MFQPINNHASLPVLPGTRVRGVPLKWNLPQVVVLLSLLTSLNVMADTQADDVLQLNSEGCEVTVYQTRQSALQGGPITEVCFIESSSSGVFKPTAEKAIKNNAHAACGCGTDKVYVQSRSETDKRSDKVVMVAFSYVGEDPANTRQVDPYEAIKLSRSAAKVTSVQTRPATTAKVFLDDYERLPSAMAQPRPTTTIWLKEKGK